MRRNKGNKILGFVENYTAFDLETTGTNQLRDEIVEIGAVKVRNGRIIGTFNTLVKPSKPIPADVIKIHGITNEMVADAPIIDDAVDEFLEFVRDDILLGHNIDRFDINMIYDAICETKGIQLRNDYVDTFDLAPRCIRGLSSYGLSSICDYFNIQNENAHRALEDTIATYKCYEQMRALSHFEIETGESRSCKKDKGHHVQFSDETIALRELKVLVEDITSDGVITIDELLELCGWLSRHEELKGKYLFDVISEATEEIIGDGIVNDEELEELLPILREAVSPEDNEEHECISDLTGCHCVITGGFKYGSQTAVRCYIRGLGGINDGKVTKKTDYVIVGSLGSKSWTLVDMGDKVQKARELNDKCADEGVRIRIIPEEDFFKETEDINE